MIGPLPLGDGDREISDMPRSAGRKIQQTTTPAIRVRNHRYQHDLILPPGYDTLRAHLLGRRLTCDTKKQSYDV